MSTLNSVNPLKRKRGYFKNSLGKEKSNQDLIYETAKSKNPKLSLYNRDDNYIKIPEELFELVHLEYLALSGFDLREIPDQLYKLHKINELELRGCLFDKFPLSLDKFPNLEDISITSDEIKELPSDLNQWHKIKYLNLGGCSKLSNIQGLPPNIEYLNIADSKLRKVPEIIFSLKYLRKLLLIGLRLKTLPIGLFNTTSLESLFVSENNLSGLPKEILKLKNLSEIWLDSNNFNEFPEVLCNIKGLKSINLGGNDLSKIPDSISLLKSLENLDLSTNNFHEIPQVLFSLKKLKALSFGNYFIHENGQGNKIRHIPENVLKLRNLKELKLHANDIENIPAEIVSQGIKSIKSYLIQLQEQELDYLFEAKLLILGEPGAGKTSLAWKLEDPTRALPGKGDSTKGITVKKHHFPINNNDLPSGARGKQRDFCLNIWDFGGQEIYKATHRFFLSNRALYILVSDTRKEETDFNYWLHIVEIFGDQSPLLIVLNEKEGHTNSVDGTVLRSRFDNIQKILQVNLLDNSDKARLDAIKSHIQFFATKLSHIGSVVPAKWKAVREAIESNTRDMISVQDYFTVCNKHGIDKQTDALVLSQYFHDIGVFLHFQKDAILKKTIFLNPTWATNAVYKVLDHEILNQNNGRFSKEDADVIWHEDAFTSVRDELLRLMQNFFLTYKISETEEYIVPEKLSYEKPNYEWPDAGNLILQYEYKPFMPKGLLAQFIVKMNRYIADHAMVWRKGVVLHWQDTLAEVTETYDVGTIKVRVAGKHRRDFMTIITAQFDVINDQYRKLNIKHLIPCNCLDCKKLDSPHFYDLKNLQRRIDKNQLTIQCETDYRSVNVKGLLYDVFNNELFYSPKSIKLATMHEIKDLEISSAATKKKIFISYAHTDEKYLTRLLTHLKVLEQEGIELDVWSDKLLKSGTKWREEIEKAMQECQVAILLVSTDFLASNFITETELPTILRGAEERGVIILPMVLTSCRYTQNKDLKEFQAQNDPSKPLVKLTPDQRDVEYMRLLDRVNEEMLPS